MKKPPLGGRFGHSWLI